MAFLGCRYPDSSVGYTKTIHLNIYSNMYPGMKLLRRMKWKAWMWIEFFLRTLVCWHNPASITKDMCVLHVEVPMYRHVVCSLSRRICRDDYENGIFFLFFCATIVKIKSTSLIRTESSQSSYLCCPHANQITTRDMGFVNCRKACLAILSNHARMRSVTLECSHASLQPRHFVGAIFEAKPTHWKISTVASYDEGPNSLFWGLNNPIPRACNCFHIRLCSCTCTHRIHLYGDRIRLDYCHMGESRPFCLAFCATPIAWHASTHIHASKMSATLIHCTLLVKTHAGS